MKFADEFHHNEAVAEIKDQTLRVLDLKVAKAREALRDADIGERVYLSNAARNS